MPKKKLAKTPTAKKPSSTIYQFKITLLDTKPKIWRRIQIPDCKLHNLHLQIQAAMGWNNSHFHHFDIKGERYGIPEHLDYDGSGDVVDSRKIMVSEIVPADGKKIAFRYTYDFGDNWEHEVLFESIVKPDPSTKYPVCVEGQRACPMSTCWRFSQILVMRNTKTCLDGSAGILTRSCLTPGSPPSGWSGG
jgi:hypothetical protein